MHFRQTARRTIAQVQAGLPWKRGSFQTVIVDVQVFPSRAIVFGALAAYEEHSAVGAPQFSASEASGNANVIDFGVVFTITCFGAFVTAAISSPVGVGSVLASQ